MNNFKDRNSNFYNGFYRALVENNGFDDRDDKKSPVPDGDKLNTVQVRVLGIHSQNNTDSPEDGIPTDNLPWAQQAGSLFGGFGPSGAGISVVPEVGSWVWIFFENGNPNKPIYFASCVGDNDPQNFGSNHTVIKTKTGHTISILDEPDSDDGSIKIQTKNGNAVILQDGENELIISSQGDVRISADNIYMGSAGGYVVTAPEAGKIVTDDGHILTADKRIRS